MRSKINLRIRKKSIYLYYVLGTAQKQFEALKKRYSRKKVNAKNKTPPEKEPQI